MHLQLESRFQKYASMLTVSHVRTTGEATILQLPPPKRQCIASRPACAVSLRDALLKLARAGHAVLTLDGLMHQLPKMAKLASGLKSRDIVERALHWLTVHDTICTYLPDAAMGGQWCVRFTI